MKFKISSQYNPTGDQPKAIEALSAGVERGDVAQVLLGVTGSGKTFTMANVIEKVQRPTLILSHNKTLAAQLYSEFKQFFPDNSVQYFVSYYDYYQPEAYIPGIDRYIEKDLMINDEIERLRLSTVSALLSGRKDVVVISSVSCLYGMGNPSDFNATVVDIKVGQKSHATPFSANWWTRSTPEASQTFLVAHSAYTATRSKSVLPTKKSHCVWFSGATRSNPYRPCIPSTAYRLDHTIHS